MMLEDRIRAALEYLGYPEERINEILGALVQIQAGTALPSPRPDTTASPAPSQPFGPTLPPAPQVKTLIADAAYKVNDIFTFAAEDSHKHHIIKNFDNLSGDGSSSDKLDLRSIFDALGGKYADGVNDFADRKAAIKLAVGDFDGDGYANDARLTIDGLHDFSVTFLKPATNFPAAFHMAPDASTGYSDLVLGGNGSVSAQPPAPAPTPTSPPVTAPSPTPSQPTPQPAPSAPSPGDGLYLGKFPAHYARLTNGVNIERSQFATVSNEELKLLHDMGVQHIRIFLKPTEFVSAGQAINPASNPGFQSAVNFMQRAIDAGLAVVFSPLGGDYSAGFISNPGDQANINMHISWWREMATYISSRFSPHDVFLEVYNEPFMSAGQAAWWNIAGQLTSAIRQAAPDFTLIVPSNGYDGGQWSFINTLTMSKPLPVTNVVYNVHYYDPMPFTHQGATWVPQFANEKHASYLGVYGYTAGTIDTAFAKLGAWAQANGVFTTVNEFGAIKFAPEAGRAQYMNDVRVAAEKYNVGWTVWDFDKGFTITHEVNGVQQIKPIFQQALALGAYNDGFVDWTALLHSTEHTTSVVTDSTNGTPQGTNAQSSPQDQPQAGTKVLYADKGYAVREKFVFTATDLNKTVTIYNFDNMTQDGNVNDRIDLRAIFEALGGKYSDGLNDVADRKAALVVTALDLSGNGLADDVKITIKGVPDFAIHLIQAASASPAAFHIASGDPAFYDDILIA